jgi:hypothetical protein
MTVDYDIKYFNIFKRKINIYDQKSTKKENNIDLNLKSLY